MSEPLTPPPTSAIEIQDAARASVPPPDTEGADVGAEPIITDPPIQELPEAVPAPAAPQQPQATTTYHFLFPSLAELAGKGDYKELVRLAERGDLTGENDEHVSRLLVTAPLVLAYLILDNLPSAGFALTRLPSTLDKHPLSIALLSLQSAVRDKQYDQIYIRATGILTVIHTEKLVPGFDLAPVVAQLIHVFIETFQQKTFALLSKAYTSIPLALAQTYLGLSTDQLLAIARRHRWTYNENTQVLAPEGPNAAYHPSRTGLGSSIATLNAVADNLILESS
ncbi:hypothetical protein EUX98_g3438 [Antrodiella citrinella]|uniref:CSN8/PSMD8/EIF3K domain-containing protein n=1 Tax=Antrodiella citrinella TaxID=2447956 RepID=A0A4S4MYM3_9APHY|nr:hypothetical protein EUX98_g3438 [Antrodiella citrinella]